MNTITDDQIAEIEALAGRATPGPWSLALDRDLSVASSEWGLFDVRQDQPNFVVDAHYVAAADPASVLGLIARLREAERDAARLEWLIGEQCIVESQKGMGSPIVYRLFWRHLGECQAEWYPSERAAIDAAMLAERESQQ